MNEKRERKPTRDKQSREHKTLYTKVRGRKRRRRNERKTLNGSEYKSIQNSDIRKL